MDDFGYRCAYCGVSGVCLHADHVIPLTDPRSTNFIANILPACGGCNSSKCDNDLLGWARANALDLSAIVKDCYNTVLGLAYANVG